MRKAFHNIMALSTCIALLFTGCTTTEQTLPSNDLGMVAQTGAFEDLDVNKDSIRVKN